MKPSGIVILCIMGALLSVHKAAGQDSTAYRQLLDSSRELVFSDSLRFSQIKTDTISLDSNLVKQYFAPLLSSGANKFKNKYYSLLGKISKQKNFDLLLVLEDKKRTDSTGFSVLYLVSLRKNGSYISSMKAMVTGTKKKSGYNISSTLYEGNRIWQESRISTNDKLFVDDAWYRISPMGRFILTGKDN